MDWFSPMPTQEANVPPQPLWENLLAKPCNPPLCVKRPPRTPTSELASPEACVFPPAASSIELRSPMVILSCELLLGVRVLEKRWRGRCAVRVELLCGHPPLVKW